MAKQIKTILQLQPSAMPAVALSAPKPAKADYNGTPYSRIVDVLLERWGIYGQPAEGNRNTTLYRLARLLRYICDFNAGQIVSVIPSWGLSADEVRATVNSALASPRGTSLPPELSDVLCALACGGTVYEDSGIVSAPNPLPKDLPPLISWLARRYPLNSRCAILASLPILGCLLSRLRARYLDGTEESPIFMTAIVGTQASGKSFLKEIYNLLAFPMLEADMESMRREQEYKEKLRRAKNSKRQPELETFPVRCIPATVSNTQLLRRAHQNMGLALLSFAPEIDTVVRSGKAGAWAQKGDVYRIGFEAGLYGQDFASDNSYSAVVELRYNLLFSGTDAAMKCFFNNVENGMSGRFCLSAMADDRGQKVQRREQDEKGMKRVAKQVAKLYEMGSVSPDNTVCHLKKTLKALDEWTDMRIAEYFETGNEALDILRRRSCLIGFRAAMVAWALCGGRESKAVVDFAVWVASEVLQQQLLFFGKELNRQDEENRKIRESAQREFRKTANVRLLSELPEMFEKSDLIDLRHKYGMEGECGYILSRWLKAGVVRKEFQTYYKLKKGA